MTRTFPPTSPVWRGDWSITQTRRITLLKYLDPLCLEHKAIGPGGHRPPMYFWIGIGSEYHNRKRRCLRAQASHSLAPFTIRKVKVE